MMADTRYGGMALILFIGIILIMMFMFPRSHEKNIHQKYAESERKADSLQKIIDTYELIDVETIKEYYNEKYKGIHDEIDTAGVAYNIELLKSLLSTRSDL